MQPLNMKYYLTGRYTTSMDPKTRILSYLADNPGLKTEQIDIGIKRASLGLHLRNLSDKGLLIRTQDGGWQVSKDHVMEKAVHNLSPMDLVEKHIREMIALN
jgi:DNA-binding transcriptional ArsR family regulator